MSVLSDRISALGPLVPFKAMQSRQRVEARRKRGFPSRLRVWASVCSTPAPVAPRWIAD